MCPKSAGTVGEHVGHVQIHTQEEGCQGSVQMSDTGDTEQRPPGKSSNTSSGEEGPHEDYGNVNEGGNKDAGRKWRHSSSHQAPRRVLGKHSLPLNIVGVRAGTPLARENPWMTSDSSKT